MFMELMTICEEDFCGAKPFRRQFLFHRLRLEKPVSAAIAGDPLLSMLRESHQPPRTRLLNFTN
jgi:hypothetical protein